MKDIIIHIGLNRTATTYLQKEVFPKLNVNFIPYKVNNRYFLTPFLKKLEDNNINLLSNESLCNPIRNKSDKDNKFYASTNEILSRLSKVFPRAKIIYCTRDLDSWLLSCYNNAIKNGYIKNFNIYLSEMEYINPEDISSIVKKLFKDYYIYKYEDFVDNPDKIISDICKFIGVPKPIVKNIRVNFSYSGINIKILRLYNTIFYSSLNPIGLIHLPNAINTKLKRFVLKIINIIEIKKLRK